MKLLETRKIFSHTAVDTFTGAAEFALEHHVSVDYIFIHHNESLDSFYAFGQAEFCLAC